MAPNELGSEIRRTEAKPEQYPVSLHFTIPFYPHSVFVSLIAGREKRCRQRLREERIRRPLDTRGNYIFAFCLGVTVGFATLFFALMLGVV